MNRVTIKDVARRAGVSPSAVSRVFTQGASASAETREKVAAAARELGYRPSLLARGLVGTRTNLVTLVMGRMHDPFDALFLDAFSEALGRRGTRLLLAPAIAGSPHDSGLLQALDYKSEAVVVAAGTVSLEETELCVRAGLPVVLSGRILEAPGVDSVLADNADGGRQAADLLIRTGCERLAFLGRGGATFADRERFEGFAAAARAAGRSPGTATVEGRDPQSAFRAATALLSAPDRPDGLFCSSDSIALAAIEAARALGLAIPDDIAIIGFNNIPLAAMRSYRLTTIDYPVSKVVDGILDLLDSRRDDPERATEIRRIPGTMVARATTRQIAPER